MKRRDFLKLSTAPAFISLLNLYPKSVSEELESKGVACLGGNRYIADTWTIHGPMVVEEMDISGPHYGNLHELPPGVVTFSNFTVYRVGGGNRETMIQFGLRSDRISHCETEITFTENQSLEIRQEGGRSLSPWDVFTVYRK